MTRRIFFELGGALLAAVLPYIAMRIYLPKSDTLEILQQTFAGCVCATLAAIWVLRSMRRYPGVESTASILPAFSITFGLLFAGFLFGRLDHSRILMASTYLLAISILYMLAVIDVRRLNLRIGVIQQDGKSLPDALWQVTWVPLDDPKRIAPGLDAVTADLRKDLPDAWERTIADLVLAGVPVLHIKHLQESLTGRLELEHISENSFGSLAPLASYMKLKHLADWILALVALLSLLPVLVVVAIMVRATSSGPALFRQQRIGYRGQPFSVFKFRTMVVTTTGEDVRTAAMTQHGDKRVTRIGGLLRRTRLDELPQILNILRGEMSWIGPRPEAEVLSRWYEQEIPFYRYRHIVRPGITGWAQVTQGHVTDVTDVTSKLHYDFYYIKNFGAWIDVLIIARTIKTVVFGYGAK